MGPAQRRIPLGLALVGSLIATSWVASQEEGGREKSRDKAPDTAQVKAGASSMHAGPAAPAAVAAAPEGLMLDKLNRGKSEAKAGDLFASDSWDPPPKAAARPAPPPPPAAPALPFTYIGKMSDGGLKIVFLEVGDRSYAARAGDVLEERYRVEEIRDGAVVLTYLPLQLRQTLNIGD